MMQSPPVSQIESPGRYMVRDKVRTSAVSSRKPRLVILSTHPIQYHAPWFRALAEVSEIDLQVWFCHKATPREQAEAGFGVEFDWDTPLLEGYSHRFLKNVAAEPTVNSYSGLDTPELKQLIQHEAPAALLVNGWHYKSAWQALRACWRTKTPVMARSDSNLRTRRSSAKLILKWPYYRWFIPRLDACLAVGSWSRDYFLHYGARAERIFTVPHVVDTEFFKRSAIQRHSQREHIRDHWRLGSETTVFLFAGKFNEKKRPMDFVSSIELAQSSGARIAGLMVGDGTLKQSCEEYVRSRRLPITFTGFLNQREIVDAYVAADSLVLPSDGGETWGLVVNEAMTCGLPCFVSDRVGSSADLVLENETGGIFPLGDRDALATLLVNFANDQSKQQRMSRQVRSVIEKYSSSQAVAGTLAALDSVKPAGRKVC